MQRSERKLKVWIFQTGEPMPLVSAGARSMRAINLANFLIEDGNEVVVWTSTFSHQLKEFIVDNKYTEVRFKHLEVRLIPSIGYNYNISFKRIIDHALLAYRLHRRLIKEREKPDILFIGFPPILFSFAAFRFSRRHNIPVMLDVKDRWPEAFVFKAPEWIKPLVKLCIIPTEKLVKNMFLNAEMISTISKGFLSWVRDYSGRAARPDDHVFYLTPGRLIDDEKYTQTLKKTDLKATSNRLNILFVGSFSSSFDFRPILEAVRYAAKNKIEWNFILCGHGLKKSNLDSFAVHYSNLQVMGSIDELRYIQLAGKADLAIAPYEPTPDFQISIPNKILDYMSFGLPTITSLDGEVGEFLKSNKCGFVYNAALEGELVQLLLDLSKNRKKLRVFGQNARKKFKAEMSSVTVYSNLVKAVKNYQRMTEF